MKSSRLETNQNFLKKRFFEQENVVLGCRKGKRQKNKKVVCEYRIDLCRAERKKTEQIISLQSFSRFLAS